MSEVRKRRVHSAEFNAKVRMEPVRTFDNAAITDWAERRLAPAAEVYSDGLGAFRGFVDTGRAHAVLVTAGGRAATEVRGALWVNAVFGNVKRALDGTYHSIARQHYARRYLGEAMYRFNRRFRLRAMLPRLMRTVAVCKSCPEPFLRTATNFTYVSHDANQVSC